MNFFNLNKFKHYRRILVVDSKIVCFGWNDVFGNVQITKYKNNFYNLFWLYILLSLLDCSQFEINYPHYMVHDSEISVMKIYSKFYKTKNDLGWKLCFLPKVKAGEMHTLEKGKERLTWHGWFQNQDWKMLGDEGLELVISQFNICSEYGNTYWMRVSHLFIWMKHRKEARQEKAWRMDKTKRTIFISISWWHFPSRLKRIKPKLLNLEINIGWKILASRQLAVKVTMDNYKKQTDIKMQTNISEPDCSLVPKKRFMS